jgi:hypothetical protein
METCMAASNPVKKYPTFDSALTALGDWLRLRQRIWQFSRRLDECDSGELGHIATDLGLSAAELRRMAKLGPDAAKLLLDRMTALHLDAEAIAKSEPGTMRDLQRLCSICASKKRCQRDLIHDLDDPVWRQYCPNAGTLDALQSEATNAC